MRKRLDDIFRSSFSQKKERTTLLLERARNLLEEERKKNGGGIVVLPPQGRAIVIGDIHGAINSLYKLLTEAQFIERVEHGEDLRLVFLGDYGDRGPSSAEALYVILKLKQLQPNRVVVLRGNHEGLPLISFSPHDFPVQLQSKYGEQWNDVYHRILDLFSSLPHCAILEGKYLFLHGGAPSETTSLNDISLADQLFPLTTHFEEILWNDPREEIHGVQKSPRGLGRLFSEEVTSNVLEILNARTLIRSHEPCEGVNVHHSGKVLTLFSRDGAPYSNMKRAYLDIDLTEEPKDASTLAEEAKFF